AFTVEIAERLNGHGYMDLYEINPSFVGHLKERIAKDPRFQKMRSRITLYHGDVRQLAAEPRYDAIVSGLPFNNFTSQEVLGLIEHFRALLKPQGTLSFFEYWGIRPLQMPFVGREKRDRLRGVAQVLEDF